MATEKKTSEKKLSPKEQKEKEKIKKRRKNQKVVVIIVQCIKITLFSSLEFGFKYLFKLIDGLMYAIYKV